MFHLRRIRVWGPVSVFFQTLEMSVERRFRLDKVSFEDGRGRVMVPDSIG